MIFAIEAREGIYEGLHGIVAHYVGEYNSYDEACEDAAEMSFEVMDGYNIAEQAGWEEDALNEGLEEESDEYYDYIGELRAENVSYSVWEVKETTESLEALNKKFIKNPEEFIEKYCVQD